MEVTWHTGFPLAHAVLTVSQRTSQPDVRADIDFQLLFRRRRINSWKNSRAAQAGVWVSWCAAHGGIIRPDSGRGKCLGRAVQSAWLCATVPRRG